jgi:LPS sulfotransferase NodH
MDCISSVSKPSIHETALRKFFKGNVIYDGPVVFDHPLYCIGFFNRSGSNLLAEHLRGTPYFSGFHEQLNFNIVQNLSKKWGVHSFPDFIIEATNRFSKGRFVYGFKASLGQLVMLERFGIPRMYAGGLRIIHIHRKDLIGQAVSYQIASQTKQWTSKQAGVDSQVQVEFDAKKLTNLIDAAQASTNGIAMFSEILGYPRLTISYEDLVENPKQVLDCVADFSGQTTENWKISAPQIERQSSEINIRFRQLYTSAAKQLITSSS